MLHTSLFDTMFCEDYLRTYFLTTLINRNGGGRDLMTPRKWWESNKQTLDRISTKCVYGHYRFAPYKEELVIKGRNKLPRCISIPTVRDRLVLGVLNKYLQEAYEISSIPYTPNSYVSDIKMFLKSNSSTPIHFFRTDITDFYNSIFHETLIDKLMRQGIDERAIALITQAIQTPTLSLNQPKFNQINPKGVPQGLAISNILASIYMADFDKNFSSQEGIYLYKRYVDDILVLSFEKENFKERFEQYFEMHKLHLTLSNDKTTEGIVGEKEFDYIGYVFSHQGVSIRPSNVNRHIRRLSHVVTSFKRALTDTTFRPPYLKDEHDVVTYYTEELNELISGMQYDNVLYGWLPYFQEADDMSLFWRMDKILRRMLSVVACADDFRLHSFVKSYYDIKQNSGRRYVRNYDDIVDVNERKAFLASRGKLASNRYNDEQINGIYENYCRTRAKTLERHIGYFN